MKKWREIAEVIEEVRMHLKLSYASLESIPCLQNWIVRVREQMQSLNTFGKNEIQSHFEGLSLSLTEMFRGRYICISTN
jgi:hypothetical protein